MAVTNKSLLKKCTFLADYSKDTVDAQYSLGSAAATFATIRSATEPATYIDDGGVLQITTTSNEPRFAKGFYDATGFHVREGVLIEEARTNYIKQTIFATDTNADGIADNWSFNEDVTDPITTSLVDVTDTFNVGATVQSERITYTGVAGDTNKQTGFTSDSSAVGSFAQSDNVTVSMYLKGSVTTPLRIQFQIREYDAANVNGTNNATDVGDTDNLSATEWRRFSYSVALSDADVSRCRAGIQFINVNDGDVMDLQITCVQLEKARYATTFIPTTTAALTRNKETLKGVILDNRTAATEACVAKISPEFANGEMSFNHITDTDTKRRAFLFASITLNDVLIYSNVNDSINSVVPDIINNSWATNAALTLGYNIQKGITPYVAGFYQGVADGTNDSTDDFTEPAWGTYFWIGIDNTETYNLNGIIQSIAFFNVVLTAEEHLWLHNNNLQKDSHISTRYVTAKRSTTDDDLRKMKNDNKVTITTDDANKMKKDSREIMKEFG